MTFAQRIAAIRKKRKLSQEKLGELINMSQRTIAAWEGSERTPSFPVLLELAEKLDVSVDYLLGRTDEEKIKEPAITDDELRAQTFNRIKSLPEPVLEKVLDLIDAIQSHQGPDSAAQADPGPYDPDVP